MRPDAINENALYLKNDGSDVRQVLAIDERTSKVYWQGYDYGTGEPHMTYICTLAYFAQWAGRELDEQEKGRMKIEKALESIMSRDQHIIMKALLDATDNQILCEAKRRGIID